MQKQAFPHSSLDNLSVVAAAVALDPSIAKAQGYCTCNAVCECETKPGCCEGKCPCHSVDASLVPTWEEIISHASFQKIAMNFTREQVKTIADFTALVEQVAAGYKKR